MKTAKLCPRCYHQYTPSAFTGCPVWFCDCVHEPEPTNPILPQGGSGVSGSNTSVDGLCNSPSKKEKPLPTGDLKTTFVDGSISKEFSMTDLIFKENTQILRCKYPEHPEDDVLFAYIPGSTTVEIFSTHPEQQTNFTVRIDALRAFLDG